MGARPAVISQADIIRAVRAMKAAGVPAVRVVYRRDGVAIEPVPEREAAAPWDDKPEADEHEVIDL